MKIVFIFLLGIKLIYSQNDSINSIEFQKNIFQSKVDKKIFTITELKEIARLLNELEYRRERDSIITVENNILKNNIKILEQENKMFKEKNKITLEKEKMYQQQIELMKPKWWNKFEYGLISGLILSVFGLIIAN